jgi:hypothetical protein
MGECELLALVGKYKQPHVSLLEHQPLLVTTQITQLPVATVTASFCCLVALVIGRVRSTQTGEYDINFPYASACMAVSISDIPHERLLAPCATLPLVGACLCMCVFITSIFICFVVANKGDKCY